MADFSFAFSYDRSRGVAWLALDGCLDGPAAGRLRRVLRTALGGLAPRRLLVDARDVTHVDGGSIHSLLRAGPPTDRPACDIVLVTQGAADGPPEAAA